MLEETVFTSHNIFENKFRYTDLFRDPFILAIRKVSWVNMSSSMYCEVQFIPRITTLAMTTAVEVSLMSQRRNYIT